MRADQQQATVTPLELFFDLVFVFALTQVTAFMAHELSWHGLVRGVLVIMLLWWAWTAYAWLANVASADERAIKLAILVGMSAMFVLALCIPEAFDDAPGGLDGPVVLAVCYLIFRVMQLRDLPDRRPGGRRPAGPAVPVRAERGRQHDRAADRVAVPRVGADRALVLALVVDYVGTALGGARGWRLPAPGHFAERHGLIVIIALGESIVAIGVGVAELPISWPIVVASALGLILASAMWWAYFDVSALLGEHALAQEPAETRPRLGRNAFSYAHLPLVVGVVMVALGLKKVLEYVGDTEKHTLLDPLKGVGLVALVGGVAIYLLAHVVFKRLTVHTWSYIRLATAGLTLLAMPLMGKVPAIGQLGIVAALLVTCLVVESVVHAETRRQIRAELAHH